MDRKLRAFHGRHDDHLEEVRCAIRAGLRAEE
jgi:hypothetical protein